MRSSPLAPGRVLLRCAAAALVCLAAVPACAAPEDGTDPVLKLLVDKGLLGSGSSAESSAAAAPVALLRQMHERTTELAVAAMDLVGVRYRRGGTSAETGFDCSGFTRHVFEMSLGLVLPRRADEQATAPGLVAVRRDDLQPGDLVFFNTLKRTFSHVGIYIGDHRFIHAPHSGASVRTEDMTFAYWAKRFTGARRVVTAAASVTPPASDTPAPSTTGPAGGS
jgi:cell wall-associated NlpC family hydrolase